MSINIFIDLGLLQPSALYGSSTTTVYVAVVLGLPRFADALKVDDFHAIMRNRTTSLMSRIRGSTNTMLAVVADWLDSGYFSYCVDKPLIIPCLISDNLAKARSKAKLKKIYDSDTSGDWDSDEENVLQYPKTPETKIGFNKTRLKHSKSRHSFIPSPVISYYSVRMPT